MKQDDLIELMKHYAKRISEQNPDGALHIFVADGNCEEDHLDFCARQHDIEPEEQAFLDEIRLSLPEEAIFGAWAIAQCEEYQDDSGKLEIPQ